MANAAITQDRPHEDTEDSYAGTLHVNLSVALDSTDEKVLTRHDFARLLLSCDDAPLSYYG